MIRTIAYSVLVARVVPYLEQQLNSISDVLAVQKYAKQSFADGDVLEFRDIRDYGEINSRTQTLTLQKMTNIGIFQAHHAWSSGTNVMTGAVDSMQVSLAEITGDVPLSYNDLLDLYDRVNRDDPDGVALEAGDVSQLDLLSPSQLSPLVAGYRKYVETYGWSGDLANNILGLRQLPSFSYAHPTPLLSLPNDQIPAAVMEPITAASVANLVTDYSRLLVSIPVYNALRSRYLPGTSDSLLTAIGRDIEVVRTPALGSVLGTPTMVYLPALDDESLFYGNGGGMVTDYVDHGDRIIIRGYAVVAGAITMEPGNVLTATNL
jgi:hypothetical protein